MLLFFSLFFKLLWAPEDTSLYHDHQFYAVNTGQYNGVEGEDLNLPFSFEREYTGKNVKVGIIASECNHTTPALINRVAVSCMYGFDGTYDCFRGGQPYLSNDIGSIIAGNKGTSCTTGIAYESQLHCFPFKPKPNIRTNTELILRIMGSSLNVNIFSLPLYDKCTLDAIYVEEFSEKSEFSLGNAILRGRYGLGLIPIMTPDTCNGKSIDPNYRIFQQSRFVINIAATTNRGDRAFYSPKSANLLFNVPSTDSSIETGAGVLSNPVYTENSFGECTESRVTRMQAANAIATGSLALLIQAYPTISWRHLQLIIALTATVNDANHSSWVKNGAGIYYSNIYGFGRLNVDRAIHAIQYMKTIPTEGYGESKNSYTNPSIPSCREQPLCCVHIIKFNIKFIESVSFTFSTTHPTIGDICIEIESPSGTRVPVNFPTNTEPNIGTGLHHYTFTCRQFLGEDSRGKWNIYISAAGCIPTGRVAKTQLRIFGMKKFEIPPIGKNPKDKPKPNTPTISTPSPTVSETESPSPETSPCADIQSDKEREKCYKDEQKRKEKEEKEKEKRKEEERRREEEERRREEEERHLIEEEDKRRREEEERDRWNHNLPVIDDHEDSESSEDEDFHDDEDPRKGKGPQQEVVDDGTQKDKDSQQDKGPQQEVVDDDPHKGKGPQQEVVDDDPHKDEGPQQEIFYEGNQKTTVNGGTQKGKEPQKGIDTQHDEEPQKGKDPEKGIVDEEPQKDEEPGKAIVDDEKPQKGKEPGKAIVDDEKPQKGKEPGKAIVDNEKPQKDEEPGKAIVNEEIQKEVGNTRKIFARKSKEIKNEEEIRSKSNSKGDKIGTKRKISESEDRRDGHPLPPFEPQKSIQNPFEQLLSPSKYKQLPPNRGLKFTFEPEISPGTELDPSKLYHVRASYSPDKDPPISFFYTIGDPDKEGSVSSGNINFPDITSFNKYMFYPPHNIPKGSEVTFIIHAYVSPTEILAQRIGPYKIREMEPQVQQYQSIQKNVEITWPYFIKYKPELNAFMTITDYDTKKVIKRGVIPNTGYVTFTIPITERITNGILTVQSLTTVSADPCDVSLRAFVVGDEAATKVNKIKFNISSCQKISGLEYYDIKSPSSMFQTIMFTPTATPNFIESTTSLDSPTASESSHQNQKKAIATISSLCSGFVIIVVIGVVITVFKVRQKKQEEETRYHSPDSESDIVAL